MPIACYRVSEPDVSTDPTVISVSTYRLPVSATNLLSVIQVLAPEATLVGRVTTFFEEAYQIRLNPEFVPVVLRLLRSHLDPVVTAMTDADLSVCLDFHSIPPDAGKGWTRTETGTLVYSAKYGDQKKYGPDLAEVVRGYVEAHPILRTAGIVVPMPGSAIGPAKSPGLVSGVAKTLVRGTERELAWIERIREPQYPQKNLPAGIDPDENQRNTMGVPQGLSGSTVLIVDDLMRDGSTLKEAIRVLHSGGVARVYSVSFTKDVKGTRGYFR